MCIAGVNLLFQTESDQLVQENVDAFVCSLRNCTVGLSSMATVTDVDLAIQEFASNFCTGKLTVEVLFQ